MTEATKSKIENVVIIGGGPAGLAAALYTARANLNPLLFAGSPPGGQLMLTSDVENYPGFEAILGPELIQKFRAHVEKFGTRIVDENVKSLDSSGKPFALTTGTGTSYKARTVIIATGAKALWLELPNEQRLRGKGVSACATCDGFFFKEKTVAVVGGGDTACEEALTLTKFAKKVYVIHRRDSFRASKIMADRVLSNPKIEVIWNTEVIDVLGENKVEGIKIRDSVKNEEKTLQIDGLFLAIGHKPDTEFLLGTAVKLDKKGYVVTTSRKEHEIAKFIDEYFSVNEVLKKEDCKHIENPLYNHDYLTMTSVPGIFAAGDNVDYLYRQAGTAVGMGIAAAFEVERWLENL